MFEKGHPVYGGFETRFKKGQPCYYKVYNLPHPMLGKKQSIATGIKKSLKLKGKTKNKKIIDIICKNCNRLFKGHLHQVYCSLDCRNYFSSKESNIKRYENDYWKEKICIVCNKPFKRQGKLYCSQKCHGIARRQENNPNWKGGITVLYRGIRFSREYAEWRKAVFERDNYTCQDCGQLGGKLHAHHIKPFAKFPELRFVVSNGKTFCEDCHKEIDENWGRPIYVQN